MKKSYKKGIIGLLFILLLIIFILVPKAKKTYANVYENIDLNTISEIKDNQELLDTVNTVNISYESDIQLVSILPNCHNLKKLNIKKATIEDLTFINNIEPTEGFELRISMGYYNMTGLENSYVKEITIDSAFITDFSHGMNLPNIESIAINNISGYEDIDYSNFHNLQTLSFDGISISNYRTFFEQLNSLDNLKTLLLIACDISDEDTVYLKELTNIKSLSLKKCNVSDVSFLEDMEQLTYIEPPINADDLSVIKKMPNLKTIYWTGYEQLALTDDLVEYMDNNNILHSKYESNLKNTLLNMLNEMHIDENMSIKEKVEKVIDYTSNYVISHDTPYDDIYTSNGLLYIVHFKAGTCTHYSLLEHALLKLIGVNTEYINGLIPVYMSELSGGFYRDDLKYEIAGHAWLMAQDENGLWYGWDPVQIDQGTGIIENDREVWNTVSGKQYNFWKNPFEDDTYTLNDYNDEKYDSFNYYFAKRRNITNKTGYNDYLNEAKITFNSNTSNTIISKQRIYKNKNFKLNKNLYEKNGHIFNSWNTKSDGSGQRYEDESIVNINDNLTLYAQWGSDSYKVQFDAGGGTGNMPDLTDIIGEYILPECEFTNSNSNLIFSGWLIEGKSTILSPGTPITINNNIKLIAQWKAKEKYTITFNTDGGSPIENQAVLEGDKAIEPDIPTKEGYIFFDWYEDSTYSSRFYFGEEITANITLYARWISKDKIIKNMNIEVPYPSIGDKAIIEKEYDYWDWLNQKPQLDIKVPQDANYKLMDDNNAYMFWVTNFEDEMEPFIGTFEYNKDYYIRTYFVTTNGYYFDKNMQILVNNKPVDKVFYVDRGYIELGIILNIPKEEKPIYRILEGENQTYYLSQGNDLVIKTNGELSKFKELKIDNVKVEPSNYSLVSGSTIVTLKGTYLNTLSPGEHDITFVYSDGIISTKINISKDNSKNETNTNNSIEKNNKNKLPQTGDKIIIWLSILIISFIGIIITTKLKKREE